VLEKAKAGEPVHDRNADGLRARRNGLLLGAPSVDGPNHPRRRGVKEVRNSPQARGPLWGIPMAAFFMTPRNNSATRSVMALGLARKLFSQDPPRVGPVGPVFKSSAASKAASPGCTAGPILQPTPRRLLRLGPRAPASVQSSIVDGSSHARNLTRPSNRPDSLTDPEVRIGP
jgi:hypothetical protein